jgi:phosphoadenosine phosphosulfate reductase
MGELTPELEQMAAAAREQLRTAVREHGRVTYANSLGAEAMVLTDIICTHAPEIEMFSIDTGRLHPETHELMERLERRYRVRIRLVHPEAEALEILTAAQGVNAFYHSLEARLTCCRTRKIEPFKRAVAGYAAWVTGVRREQSPLRAKAQVLEWDAEHSLYKVSPLLDWTESHVWQYIRARQLPYNVLHDRHYPSIGCSPCTRAVLPGESNRAGRWWWEQAGSRECGLHPRAERASLGAS